MTMKNNLALARTGILKKYWKSDLPKIFYVINICFHQHTKLSVFPLSSVLNETKL